MTTTPLFNVVVQMVAAFVIFITGFAALFAVLLVCSGVVWILRRCVDRLAALMSQSARSRLALESPQTVAPNAQRSHPVTSRALVAVIPIR
jgi:uncharacterized membrane protein YfbV (UPF0208 family)